MIRVDLLSSSKGRREEEEAVMSSRPPSSTGPLAVNHLLTASVLAVPLTEHDPNYVTHYKRATAYLSLGRNSQALDDFDSILKLNPTFSKVSPNIIAFRSPHQPTHANLISLVLLGSSREGQAVRERWNIPSRSSFAPVVSQGQPS